jgi:hypothetical protein
MGLTIYYNGRFSENASLPEMIEEVKDIADTYKWDYTIFEEIFPRDSVGRVGFNENIYGISITPPESEPLYLCFLSNGRMSNYLKLKFWGKADNDKEKRYLTMLSTKTQYAGLETHKLIIHLLKYLNEKYFSELEVIDDTGYWETGDEKLLEKRFKEMSGLLDQVWFGLNNFPKDEEETFETYFNRLLKLIHIKKPK